MPAATTRTAAEPLPLDTVAGLSDGIAEHFKPSSAYERILVRNYAAATERYDQALDVERRAFAKTDPLEMLEKFPERFKALTRYVAECERAARRALEELRRAIRQRPKTAQASSQARQPERPPVKSDPAPAPASGFAAQPAVRRE